MAQEPWNKINIPFPSAVSSIRITFTASTDILISCLLADCETVLTLLCSEVLQTEIRVLYELLYVLNNGFRQHKPFRALKQVEQCVNRLKEMKLQAAVEDLQELCPNKFQRDAGAEVGECDVPSQPMLEWLCLKLLGASSLLARTLERCTQAFLLTRQHLQLREFIVLNVVMLSMLSRLWVFFRGILRALVPMYKRATELLQKVSQSKPMNYLTDFTLPSPCFYESVSIPFEQKELECVFTVPADLSAECTAVVLTHGAGGDMHVRQLESLAHALARSGVLCLRFTCRAVNFMYRFRAYLTVVNYLKSHERFAPTRIFLGGRSMGARTAVAVCERMQRQKDAVQGVLCLSFPLHLPGKPLTYVERSRGLLALSQTSVLFVSGTADNLCEKRLLENIRHVMENPSAVHWVNDANHGLKVRGRTEESVLEEVNPQIIAWVLQRN